MSRPRIQRHPFHLFRAHVGGRPHDHALSRLLVHQGGRMGQIRRLGTFGDRLGQAEIQNLDPVVGRNHHVGRLQVPVDDPSFVGGLQASSNLHRVTHGLLQGQRTVFQELRQRLAIHQLQDEKLPVVHLLEAVDGGDVGVVERCQQPRFALETGQAFRVLGIAGREDLDGDLPVQARIPGAVDLAHAPGPEGSDDLVAAEQIVRHFRRPVSPPPEP